MMKKCLMMLLAFAALAFAEPLKIGWACRDITPQKPGIIPGASHLRLSTGVIDPLTTTALVLSNGDEYVIFLSVDALQILETPIRWMKEELKKRVPEIDGDRIICNGTHTHTGGDLYPLSAPDNWNIPFAEYSHFFAKIAAETVAEAWKNRKPGQIAWGYGLGVIGFSRRSVFYGIRDDVSIDEQINQRKPVIGFTLNGEGVLYGNANHPKFSHYESSGDHFQNFLFTFDMENHLTGAIVNAACPAQATESGTKITADYWHNAREEIRKKHPGIFIMPQCAAAGDLAPRQLHYQKAQARKYQLRFGRPDEYRAEWQRVEMGEILAHSFETTLAYASKDIRKEVPLKYSRNKVNLEKINVPPEAIPAEEAAKKRLLERREELCKTPEGKDYFQTNLTNIQKRIIHYSNWMEQHQQNPWFPTTIHTVRVGDVGFVTCQFELYTDYMIQIQGRSPFEQTFIVQLTAGAYYLPTERAVKHRGYSTQIGQCQVSPKGGRQLVEYSLQELNKLR